MNNPPVQCHPGTYQARVPGLVVGTVGWPKEPRQLCQATIHGYTDGVHVRATGGNLGAFAQDWTNWSSGAANSFTLPVREGLWEIAVVPLHQGVRVPPCQFSWFSLAGCEETEVPRKVADETPNIHRLTQNEAAPACERIDEHREGDIANLISLIEVILAKPIPSEIRQELVSLIVRI